ncbi:MAG: phosphoenolpyruvate--protein phosphotransferase [Elusimicrobia bacterium]|jgi:phosphotransferase system enzyme I (PtsI)|nr:phosphoenolpyruvate--protein phosphotransferase [Elusimicrobiota bacterium]
MTINKVKKMKFKGIPASEGIAIGRAYLMAADSYCVIKRNIEYHQVKKEVSRFKDAIDEAEKNFEKQHKIVVEDIGKKYANLFDAYMLILKDPIFYKGIIKIIKSEKVNVEYALQKVIDDITKSFKMMDDPYMKDRVHDVQDVGNKVMGFLLGSGKKSLKDIQTRKIIVAHMLHPSDAVDIKKGKSIGFATDLGGKTSHIVIMAESLGIPAVVGLKSFSSKVSPGDLVIIDGTRGIVYVNPDTDTIRSYRSEKKELDKIFRELIKLTDKPAVTKCGQKISLAANIEDVEEVDNVKNYGADGIGLYRTEYMYLNRFNLPEEEDIFKKIKGVVENISPAPVVVRIVDIGADKVSKQLKIDVEKNTFMGLRGIRLCLAHPIILTVQLRAILRASKFGNLSIMYPMITDVSEIEAANEILKSVKEELDAEGIEYNKNLKVGVMIETPAAALDIDYIAPRVDFVSIGTNDLIQYTLAVARDTESVAYLYNPADISVIKLINRIIYGAKKSDKWISMCGEMAANTLYTELLIGMGLRKFSMTASYIPKVKQIILGTTVEKCEKLLEKVKEIHDTNDIIKELQESRNKVVEK